MNEENLQEEIEVGDIYICYTRMTRRFFWEYQGYWYQIHYPWGDQNIM